MQLTKVTATATDKPGFRHRTMRFTKYVHGYHSLCENPEMLSFSDSLQTSGNIVEIIQAI